MKIFTSHLRESAPPILVREGFSWAALLFGWLFFLVQRAWVVAALTLMAATLTTLLARRVGNPAPILGLMVLQGLLGRDLLRWSVARRGYTAGPVVAAPDQDSALARLIGTRPDLFQNLAAARL